jgi:hypothetical protein
VPFYFALTTAGTTILVVDRGFGRCPALQTGHRSRWLARPLLKLRFHSLDFLGARKLAAVACGKRKYSRLTRTFSYVNLKFIPVKFRPLNEGYERILNSVHLHRLSTNLNGALHLKRRNALTGEKRTDLLACNIAVRFDIPGVFWITHNLSS